jgi:hypothetical protein
MPDRVPAGAATSAGGKPSILVSKTSTAVPAVNATSSRSLIEVLVLGLQIAFRQRMNVVAAKSAWKLAVFI